MSECTLTKAAYEQLVREDIEWLERNTKDTLERKHIIDVLRWSTTASYEEYTPSTAVQARQGRLVEAAKEAHKSIIAYMEIEDCSPGTLNLEGMLEADNKVHDSLEKLKAALKDME